MRVRIQDRLLWPFALATALVAAVATLLYPNALKLGEDTRQAARTRDVIGQLERTLSTVKDAETGERGYLLTGEERYLEPYHSAIAQVGRDLGRLRKLTADNAEQQRRIAPIEAQVAARLGRLGRNIELRRNEGYEAARRSVLNGEGKAMMDALRRMVAEAADEEERLLVRRERDARAALRTIEHAYLASLLGSLGVLAALYWALARYFRARERAEADVREQREWLEVTLRSIGDAVIATDPEGRVTFINPVAQALCGWTAREAAGRGLEEVFAIFNEETRERTESPVPRAMRTGRVVGLANHTVLVARDGRETAIEDGAAPIKDDRGDVRGVILVFRDATELRRAERAQEAVNASEQRFRALVNATSDVVYRMSPDWSEMLPLDGRGLVASNAGPIRHWLEKNIPAFEHARVRESIAAAVATKGTFELEHRVTRPDGSIGWTFSRAVPIFAPGGEIIEWFGTASDVTRRKEDEHEIREQAERLRENDRRKDEFLAMLAHELRNPLAAIGNAVQLTTRAGLLEHIEWPMDVITRQMKHLTHLIDDLLDISRINRGKIELRRGVHDLRRILGGAVESVRPLVEERKHTLEVATGGGDLWASVDPTRLEQVVVNLLTNAAKYSDNGGHIRLTARKEGNEVVISVGDRGHGIAADVLPRMFELFAQGDRSLARSEGGLGIGLTVVKKLAEMHGGTIQAVSEGPGKGSEFTIRLPGAARPAGRPSRREAPGGGEARASRIVVVDDNVDTARGMARLLKLLGHDVAVAHGGPEGIEAARRHRPDFVLLDIGLPGMDGYEVAARLRQEECCKGAVIIAVSGYGQEEDRRRSKEAGFDHHLIKPLDHDALLALLSAGVGGR